MYQQLPLQADAKRPLKIGTWKLLVVGPAESVKKSQFNTF
jgi:hypothetical protein